MSIARELSAIIRYFELVGDQLDERLINDVLAVLGAMEERIRLDESLGCQRVRTSDGYELDVTIDEMAWDNAEEDSR